MFNAATFNSILFNSTVAGKNKDLSITPVAGGDLQRQIVGIGTEAMVQVTIADTLPPDASAGDIAAPPVADARQYTATGIVSHPATADNLGTIDADAPLDADGPYNAGSIRAEHFRSPMGTATIRPEIGREDVPNGVT